MAITATERQGLLRRLTTLTRNADAAEDCLQSAFLRLEEFRRNNVVENEGGFLFRAAANIAIDEARKSRTRAEVWNGIEHLEHIRATEPLQDEVLMARERLRRVREALDQLPERTRSAFLMHRSARLKYRDIAARLGISVSAVEKHIAKASLALANSLEWNLDGSWASSDDRNARPRRGGGVAGASAVRGA